MRTLQGTRTELTPEENAELLSRLATDMDVQPDQLDLLFVCTPSFFHRETCIFKVADTGSGGRWPASMGYCYRKNGLLEVELLDRNSIDGVNTLLGFIAKHPEQLQLDENTVPDYVRFFLGTWGKLRGQALIEEPEDIHWYTKLLTEEARTLTDTLVQNPVEIIGNAGGIRFEVLACMLQADQLKRINFFVDNDSETHSLGKTELKMTRGDLDLRDELEEVLLEGLPDNYMYAPHHWAAVYAHDMQTEQHSDWVAITHRDEKYAILQDIFRHLAPVATAASCTLRRKYLPFYREFLYEIGFSHNGTHKVVPVIWSPGSTQILEYDTDSIIGLNRRHAAILNTALDDKSSVEAYVRFMTEHRWDEHGPGVIVEDRQHESFSAVRQDTMVTVPDITADAAWARIEALSVHREDDHHVVEFCKWSGFAIYHYRMHIKRNGDVVVNDGDIKHVMSFEPVEGHTTKPPEVLGAALNPLTWSQTQNNRDMLKPCSAASLVDRIEKASGTGKLTIANRVIHGCLDLEGVNVNVGLVFRNCRFRSPANLSSFECTSSLGITTCVFENGLNLAHANISHALTISQSIILAGSKLEWSLHVPGLHAQSVELTQLYTQRGIYASGLHIYGDVQITDLSAHGPLSMHKGSIGGTLYLASDTRPFCIRGYVDMDFIRVRSAYFRGITVDGAMSMEYGSIDQYLAFQATGEEQTPRPVRIGHWGDDSETLGLSLYGINIEHNYLSIEGIDIAGDLNATFIRVGTGLFIEPHDDRVIGNRIGGSLEIGGAIIPQVLRLIGCRIDGDLDARGISAGKVTIRESYLAAPSVKLTEPVMIGGRIVFSEAVIDGDVLFAGISASTKDASAPCSLEIRRATIKGNLGVFATVQTMRELEDNSKSDLITRASCADFPRGINIRKTSVGGDLELSHVQAAEGQIDMTNASIGWKVVFKSRPSDPPAITASLNMNGVHCGGDINISGLIIKADSPRTDIPAPGSILAKDLTVDGTLEVYRGGKNGQEGKAALIPGKLDLNDSNLGELSISYKYFTADCDRENLESRGILLNKATIEKLSVTVDNGFPCPIDLRFADIKWWEFNRRGNVYCENADDYIDLLDNDPNPQRHTWRAVEDGLYERGYEDAADQVHRKMRHWVRENALKDARNSQSLWKWAWAHLLQLPRRPLDFFTQFGTTTWRLALTMLVWFSLSVYLFSINENIAPSEEGLAATNTSLTSNDHPAAWSGWDGFWMATRFHVPIVLFTARDEWEPTNGNRLVIYRNADRQTVALPLGDAEEYANLVIALHWIAWPIILITASRKLFRRAGK